MFHQLEVKFSFAIFFISSSSGMYSNSILPLGIPPLVKAIRKARMNEMQLTSLHGKLLQLCLMAQNLKPALEFLNPDITDICSEV